MTSLILPCVEDVEGGDIFPQTFDYTDNICLSSHRIMDLGKMCLERWAGRVRLKIDANKSKVLRRGNALSLFAIIGRTLEALINFYS